MRGFSLYIHIPFCYHKCPYCDFNTYAQAKIPEKEYTSALLSELDFYASRPEWRGRPVRTVFFGGGTPSLFASSSIRRIIVGIARNFPVEDRVEISLEANPGSVTIDSIQGYREAGINRISFGSQSFNMETLKQLGRMHTSEQIFSSVEYARSAGFNNINLDLIYGVPKQTVADLRKDLEQSLELAPNHISAYGLTIEKGTPFYTRFKSGSLIVPSEEVVLDMMREISIFLPQQGLHRYEISNYCILGKEARHNLAYWDGDDYLGLGAGAHSFILGPNGQEVAARRWSNFASPQKYIKQATTHGRCDSWSDSLAREDLIFEFFFLGLRKTEGVSIEQFETRFGVSMTELYDIPIQILVENGWLTVRNGYLRFTEAGVLVADSVIENFVYPSDKKRLKDRLKLVAKERDSHEDLPKDDSVKLAGNDGIF